jgi:hypothetical protein
MDPRVTRVALTVLLLLALVTTIVLAQPPTPPGPPRVPPDPTDRRALTVTKSGTGSGTVTGPGITCGSDCTENYIVGTTTVIFATPTVGSTFIGWSGGGCTGTSSCSVTMTQAQNVTATFTVQTFTLLVQKSGTGSGTVTSVPTGISCGTDCTQDYAYATSVTLAQSAGAGSSFAGWTGDCTGTGPCVLSLTQARTVTASFSSAVFPLTVTKAGTGSGTVTSTPAGINCGADCTESYAGDTSVTLAQSALSGSVFVGWSGSCSGTGPCVVTMDQAKTVTATFNTTSPIACVGPDFAAVNAAVMAAAPGATVRICGGSATYLANQTISPPTWMSIIGAGAGTDAQCAAQGTTGSFTCLTRGSAADAAHRIFSWSTVSGGLSRLSGMTLIGSACCQSVSNGGTTLISGSSGTFRMDNIRFSPRGSGAPDPQYRGYVRGVMDHVTIQGGGANNTFTVVHTSWLSTGANGDKSWNSPLTLGMAEALYFEDNTFPNQVSVGDGAGGSRVVFRFNSFDNVAISTGHGTEERDRGRIQQENYNNTVTQASSGTAIGSRSGVQFNFDNRFVTTVSSGLIIGADFFAYRSPTERGIVWGGAPIVRTVSSLMRSGTTVTGTTVENPNYLFANSYVRIHNSPVAAYNGVWLLTSKSGNIFTFTITGTPANDTSGQARALSPWDTPATATPAYPALDLNCWGPGSVLLSGSNATNTLPREPPGHTLVGCLTFNNLRGPSATVPPTILIPGTIGGAPYIQENRELWNQNTSPSCNTASGTCTTGGGRGPIENRPSAAAGGGCSSTNGGVFYWATNQGNWRKQYGPGNFQNLPPTTPYPANSSGKLYRCTSPNTWTPWYGPNKTVDDPNGTPAGEPYTYPHPLTEIP